MYIVYNFKEFPREARKNVNNRSSLQSVCAIMYHRIGNCSTKFTIQISNINEIKIYLYNANRETETSVYIEKGNRKKNPLFNIKKMKGKAKTFFLSHKSSYYGGIKENRYWQNQ